MISPQQAHSIISNLQSQGDALFKLTLKEEHRLEAINDAIEATREEVKLTKARKNKFVIIDKQIGGIDATKHNDRIIHKNIDILENRLNKLRIRLNETNNQNKDIKENINRKRHKRITWNNLHAKLSKEYEEVEKNIETVLQTSTAVNEQRVSAVNQLNNLVKDDEEQQRQFEHGMNEYLKVIERQRNLESKLKSLRHRKNVENDPVKYESPGVKDHELNVGEEDNDNKDTNNVKMHRGKFSIEDERQIRDEVRYLGRMCKDVKLKTTILKKDIANYLKAFQDLQKKANSQNLDEVVRMFIQREENNFSIFNHIQNLNEEIEKTEKSISKLRHDKKQFQKEEDKANAVRKNMYQEIQDKLHELQMKNDMLESKYATNSNALKQVTNAVQSIFFQCNCQSIVDKLESQGQKLDLVRKNGIVEVSEQSVLQYLGIIEQRTLELTKKFNLLQVKALKSKSPIRMHQTVKEAKSALTTSPKYGPSAPMQKKRRIKINLPKSYNDAAADSDDEDLLLLDNNVPWKQADIRKTIGMRLSQKK